MTAAPNQSATAVRPGAGVVVLLVVALTGVAWWSATAPRPGAPSSDAPTTSDGAPVAPRESLAVRAGCSLLEHRGLRPSLRSASAVLVGRVTGFANGGEIAIVSRQRLLAGAAPDPVDVRIGDHAALLPPGSDLLLLLQTDGSGPRTLIPAWPAPLRVNDADLAGLEELAAGLASGQPPTPALLHAVRTGGDTTRWMALLDLAATQATVDALDARAINDLITLLGEISPADPRTGPILTVLASRGNGAHASVMASRLAAPGGTKLRDMVQRLFTLAHFHDPAVTALEPLLAPSADPRVRRTAAAVLARVGESGAAAARDRARSLLDDADPEVAATAWISLAGTTDASLGSRACDILRTALQPERPTASTPIARTLEERAIDDARHEGATGRTLALMTAGFYLARSPDAANRAWLAQRLDYLGDAVARTFLRDRLTNDWTSFDTAW